MMIKPQIQDNNSVSFMREDGVTFHVSADTFDGPGTLHIHADSPERHAALRFEPDAANEGSIDIELLGLRGTNPAIRRGAAHSKPFAEKVAELSTVIHSELADAEIDENHVELDVLVAALRLLADDIEGPSGRAGEGG